MKHFFVWLSMCAVCFFPIGCSLKNLIIENRIVIDETAIKGKYSWPDQQLKDKFQEYWGYRCAGDADRSFMLEAQYAREMVLPERYKTLVLGAKGISCTGISIDKIEWSTSQLVHVDFYLKHRNNEKIMGDVYFRDSWIIMDNHWSHAFKDPFILKD